MLDAGCLAGWLAAGTGLLRLAWGTWAFYILSTTTTYNRLPATYYLLSATATATTAATTTSTILTYFFLAISNAYMHIWVSQSAAAAFLEIKAHLGRKEQVVQHCSM